MKPTFAIQDLQQCTRETRERAAALRTQVQRLEKWAEDIAHAEAHQANLSGEVERLQGELIGLFAMFPAEIRASYAGLMARAAENEVARLDALEGAGAETAEKKTAAQ